MWWVTSLCTVLQVSWFPDLQAWHRSPSRAAHQAQEHDTEVQHVAVDAHCSRQHLSVVALMLVQTTMSERDTGLSAAPPQRLAIPS